MSKKAKFFLFWTIFVLLMFVPALLRAEKLYIPPAYLLKDDISKQNEINRKLEIEDSLKYVEAGLISPGWVDLDHPNVRFQLAYNRWIKLWNTSIEQGSIDYSEVLAFEDMVEKFEAFVKRVERERERGY